MQKYEKSGSDVIEKIKISYSSRTIEAEKEEEKCNEIVKKLKILLSLLIFLRIEQRTK